MAKLGFLGLGIMGYPMARNLLQAGHEVGLWSHTAAKAKQLAEATRRPVLRYPRRSRRKGRRMYLPVRRRQRNVRGGDPWRRRDRQGR